MTTQEGKLYLGGELFNVTGNNIIADADYIVDRTINKTQGEINQLIMDVLTKPYKIVDRITFSDNDFLLKVFIYANNLKLSSLPVGCSILFAYEWGDGSISAEEFDDITFLSWNSGVAKSVLFFHNTKESDPEKVMVRLIKNDKNVVLDLVIIDLIGEAIPSTIDDILTSVSNIINTKANSSDIYTKTEVDTMLESIEAGGSGDTNLQEANLQDIQAVFNMQYQQASPEVIDPHENP